MVLTIEQVLQPWTILLNFLFLLFSPTLCFPLARATNSQQKKNGNYGKIFSFWKSNFTRFSLSSSEGFLALIGCARKDVNLVKSCNAFVEENDHAGYN